MTTQPSWFQWDGEDLLLDIRLQPRASRDEMVGTVWRQSQNPDYSPPLDGKANIHLVRFLSEVFGTPKSRIELDSCQARRHKRVRIRSPESLPPGIIHH